LRIGVRIDQPGVLLRDYHTAKSEKSAYVTHRYYVSDAVFLAGLEGEADLLETIQHALGAPFFPLFLGRRSCPPAGQIALGIRRGKTLLQALQEEPVLAAHETRTTKNSPRLRLMLDAQAEEEAYFLRDQPVSFSQSRRVHGFRRVREMLVIPLSGQPSQSEQESPTLHDPFLELED
jgi:CRISPR system Cascade subunit CasD